MVDAIILAGGLGTRLRDTVPHLPKPLAPIRGVAFLDLLLEQIEQSGVVKKIILALGYKADAVIERYSKRPRGLPIEFSVEEIPLGTGGAVVKALEKTDSSPFFVFNGDSYLACSLSEMVRKFRSPAMIAYTHVEESSQYGKLEIDPEGKITAFYEKQPILEAGFVNGGVYLFDPKIFERHSDYGKMLPAVFSLERELFPQLIQEGLFGFHAEGIFSDIGTKDSYQKAQLLLEPLLSEKMKS